jgi:adenylate cyclase
MLINYRGPAGSFTTISFSDLFDTDKRENISRLLKNRIAVVGVTHSGLQDIYMTPFYSYNQKWTAGVECHANAISTVLNTGNCISRTPPLLNFLLYFIIAALLCTATGFIRISYSFSILGLMVLILGILSYVLFTFNYYFSFFIPLFALLFSYVSIISIRMVAREKEKSTIRQVFNQYVSNQVVDQLLLHPENLSLGGKALEITTIFSDVRGFTPLSESKTPEEVVSILNTYFELMVAIITKYKGTINKFIGDAIMILYGAPVIEGHTPEKMAHNAIRTAIEMQETMKASSDPLLQKLRIGIGITTGFSVVGNIGAKKHKDYTAIGDKVNLAARLESKAKPYEILIDAQTYEYCKDSFTFEKLEPFQVKGKQEMIQGYRVVY